MRLFVALDLPDSIIESLRSIRLAAARGIRPTAPEQMHVTLHFIGKAETDVVRHALSRVSGKPILVSVRGTGRFRVADGRQILWAGVAPDPALLELHATCAQALASIGIEIEARRYKPHVTLARLGSSVPEAAVGAFLQAERQREFGAFVARRFVLYDSVAAEHGARYERVASFPLS